jgi:hypothetical protein
MDNRAKSMLLVSVGDSRRCARCFFHRRRKPVRAWNIRRHKIRTQKYKRPKALKMQRAAP